MTTSDRTFYSPEPEVYLEKAFTTPFKNVIATARTCYSSKGIIKDQDVDLERWTSLAKSIFDAGHHTTFQHAQFQFRIANVSRQFIWSFLHSHPFYNSEQVSQRYVEVKPGNYAVPPFESQARDLYIQTVETLFGHYRKMNELLIEPTRREFYRIFPARQKYGARYEGPIKKKTLEAARYVLPVSMFAYLYHTVSGITLMRYYRLCKQYDAPLEQTVVLQKMIDAMLEHDEGYKAVLQEPLAPEEMPEFDFLAARNGHSSPEAFIRYFDESLEGYTSKLIDYKANAESVLAESVRETLGLTPGEMSDEDAIDLVLNPAKNRILGESMVLTTHSKLSRAMYHVHYTFRRKLSHTADSQDQRHRMTPASRPVLAAQISEKPDYIVPAIVREDEAAMALYEESMNVAWDAYNRLKAMGASEEFAMYVLPNALTVRYTESSDLLNLHHKHTMRLCYNAQEEIWRSSLDEAKQIRAIHPAIGKYLLPPCSVRDMAGTRPVCPEGDRFCGLKVWRMDVEEYERVL